MCPAGSRVKVQTNERIYSGATVCWPDTEVQRCTTRNRFIVLQAVQILHYPVNTACIWPSFIRVHSTYVMTSVTIWCGISARTYVESFNTMKKCDQWVLCKQETVCHKEKMHIKKHYRCFYRPSPKDHRPVTHKLCARIVLSPLKLIESGFLLMLTSKWAVHWWQHFD